MQIRTLAYVCIPYTSASKLYKEVLLVQVMEAHCKCDRWTFIPGLARPQREE